MSAGREGDMKRRRSRKFEPLSFSLEPELRDKVESAADEANISRSEWLRLAAVRLLADSKKFPKKFPA